MKKGIAISVIKSSKAHMKTTISVIALMVVLVSLLVAYSVAPKPPPPPPREEEGNEF